MPNAHLENVAAYLRQQQPRMFDELCDFLRIPSISTLPEHRPDMARAAEFLRKQLAAAGLEHIETLDLGGHAVVYADWLHAPGAPTVLCYGHYDVQPPDPIDEWMTPPFEPTVRDGNVHARGAADDKGQVFTHIKAIEAWMRTMGRLPVNVRVAIEGEEEVGGESIDKLVRQQPHRVACHCALVSDTAMFAPGLPSLDVGLRGLVYTEIEAQGAERDLHSGVYGGVAPNPLEALARIVAGLKGDDGRIRIAGFHDRVRPPAEAELEAWRRLPFDAEAYRRDEVRATALTGELQYSALERTWARPTLEVHGVRGGFTGAGSKTVIPARASAKVSMRLVPDQRPGEIFELFTAAVRDLAPAGVAVCTRLLNVADPVLVSPDNPWVQAAVASLREVFHAEPVYVRSGGSIPVVALFHRELKIPVVMMGFGLPDDGLHSPNEKFAVANFFAGCEAVADFLGRAGELAAG